MVNKMEVILGVGSIRAERKIPGTAEGESESVRYVSFNAKDMPANQFRTVTRKVNPPLISGGGAVLEGCIIDLPDGTPFYSLYFHGDIFGWQKQIEQGAQELGLLSARIDAEKFIVSDGRSFALKDCNVKFD